MTYRTEEMLEKLRLLEERERRLAPDGLACNARCLKLRMSGATLGKVCERLRCTVPTECLFSVKQSLATSFISCCLEALA